MSSENTEEDANSISLCSARPAVSCRVNGSGSGSVSVDGKSRKNNFSLNVEAMWIVALPLRFVPPNYPLAAGYCTGFISDIGGKVIAARVKSCLRQQSIYAVFNSRDASAICQSMDRVTFKVSLFSGRGDFAHGVIIEVRRYSGDSISFFRYRCAVILAAQGKAGLETANDKGSNLSLLAPDINDEENRLLCQEALIDILCLLKDERQDTQLLGMESLRNLTDEVKSGGFIAHEVSIHLRKRFGGDESACGDSDRVGSAIMEHLMRHLWAGHLIDEKSTEFEESHIGDVRLLSLQVFKNIMANSTHGYALLEEKFLVSNLVPVLIEELKHASVRPHGAYFAASCLYFILQYSSCATLEIKRASGLELFLSRAHSVGVSGHALLQDATERVLQRLDFSPH